MSNTVFFHCLQDKLFENCTPNQLDDLISPRLLLIRHINNGIALVLGYLSYSVLVWFGFGFVSSGLGECCLLVFFFFSVFFFFLLLQAVSLYYRAILRDKINQISKLGFLSIAEK